jgi:hypothetical protein
VIVVRFADDIVLGFQHRSEAVRFLADLQDRFRRFGLELHPDKTRLIAFGRFAAKERKRRGEAGKPETFDFLGFTHICDKTRFGKFIVLRQTKRTRMRAKLAELKQELRHRMHHSIPEVGQWLRAVVRGHYQYYGVPRNGPALHLFRRQVIRLWCRTLRRRSHKHRVTWARMGRLAASWLPTPRICHPYPEQRLARYYPRQEYPEQRLARYYPRQEPSALAAHAGICGGGGQR